MVELIERDYALQRLLDAAELARQGAGGTALVYGEAGIGKTSLVRRMVSAHGDGRVLWGGCEALFSPRPLGPVYDMAAAFSPGLRGMLGLEGRRAELFAALLSELEEAPGTTLMVLEDLHWADAATLDLIKYLARRIRQVHALLVLTYRDDEIGERHPLRLVFGDLPTDAVTRVPLLPLTETAVGEMARQTGHSADGLFAATGGNPFFVTEALCADGVPASVRDAVLARAARQPPAVRALLDLAAIVPARIGIGMVDTLLAPTREDIFAALASGLLLADRGAYAYRHELARMAMEQALPAPLAASLHAQVLAFLEAGGDEVAKARLVHHAAGAGDSAAVLKYSPQAAAEAVSHGAHCDAATLYATALAHAGGLPPQALAELLEQHAYQCHLTGQIETGRDAYLSALAIWRDLGNRRQEGHIVRWLSRLCWFGGRNSEALAYADEAVRLLETLPADSELAWALSNRSQLYMLSGETEHAVRWGERAIDLATTQGDAEVLAHALNNVGTARLADGQAEGKAMLERSLHLSLEKGYCEHVARAYTNLVSTSVKNRDYPAALRFLEDAAVYFAERDLDSWCNYVRAYRARLDFEQGRWDAADTQAGQIMICSSTTPVTRIPVLTVLAQIRSRRGDPGAAVLLEEACKLAIATGELQRIAPAAAARAEAAWLRDDDAVADAMLLQACDLAERLHDPRELGRLRYWCRKLGVEQETFDDVEEPYALQLAGLWRCAAEAWEQLGCPYERALALLEGDEPAILQALSILSSLGATATLRRCHEQLRQAGMRGLARGPRASTAANPAGLTVREGHILRLLTQGLSNADIANRIVRSEKTVEHHISAILRKLDVCSRGEAAAAATRLGLIEPR